MKKLFTFLALCYTLGFMNAQGTIQINNFTSYTLNFQLMAEPNDNCDFFLLNWDEDDPVSGFNYIFILTAGNSVTYTSYGTSPSQTPAIPQWRKYAPFGQSPYPASVAQTLYNLNTHWSGLKFDLIDSVGTVVMNDTIGIPSDCNEDPTYSDGGIAFAEIYTLSGITYFNVY